MERLGAMIDCSRNAVLSVAGVKKLVDYLQKMGYTYIELYTEDTYELSGEPFFGYMRGRYSAEEIREIDGYCFEKGIELVPCVQTLAHLDRMFKWGAYSSVRDYGNILLVGEEKTYELIEKIFAFCAKNFRSKRINIGMDEAHMLGRGKYYDENGHRAQFDIFAEHLKRVVEIAKKWGFEPTIWSDMFFRTAAKGEYLAPEVVFTDREKNAIPKGVNLCFWDYFTKEEELLDRMIEKHYELTDNVCFAGAVISCFGFHSANYVSLDRLPKGISSCKRKGVKDVLVTSWGDGGAECSCFALLPSYFIAAESFYGRSLENIEERFYDLFGERWEDFLLLDLQLPVSIPSQLDIASGAKEMLFSDYFNGFLDDAVTGTGEENRAYLEYAEKLENAAKRSRAFGYLFESHSALCNALAVKYDLGVKTRLAYQSGDKEKVKQIIADYDKVSVLVKAFINKFERSWFTDRKTHGFDVQDLRLGGLLQRTESCKNRLIRYVNGEIDKIEELEIKIEKLFEEKQLPLYNRYCWLATSNQL